MTKLIEWAGRTAIVPDGAQLLSERCVICGQTDGVSPITRRFESAPFIALARNHASATFSMCWKCDRRALRLRRLHLAMSTLGFLVLVVSGSLFGARGGDDVTTALGGFSGFLLYLLAITLTSLLLGAYAIRCMHLKDAVMSLRFPNVKLARELHPPS